jgi:hypothetical protein
MINKKGVWFLTLFSLILVLSVYYITMPPELLIAAKKEKDSTPVAKVDESSILVALRVEADEDMENEINTLKKIISNAESSVEEKNEAFEKIKELNSNRSVEEVLESKILSKHELKAFVLINNNSIEVIVTSDKHDDALANSIMRTIQEEFDTSKNISIKFQK